MNLNPTSNNENFKYWGWLDEISSNPTILTQFNNTKDEHDQAIENEKDSEEKEHDYKEDAEAQPNGKIYIKHNCSCGFAYKEERNA